METASCSFACLPAALQHAAIFEVAPFSAAAMIPALFLLFPVAALVGIIVPVIHNALDPSEQETFIQTMNTEKWIWIPVIWTLLAYMCAQQIALRFLSLHQFNVVNEVMMPVVIGVFAVMFIVRWFRRTLN